MRWDFSHISPREVRQYAFQKIGSLFRVLPAIIRHSFRQGPLPEASVTSVNISHEFGIVKHKTLDNDDLSAWNDEHIIGDQFMTVGMPFLVDGVSSAEWVENCGTNCL